MKFKLVTAAAFLSLVVALTAGCIDVLTHHRHEIWFNIWLLAVMAEAILFPWFGALLGRQ